MLASKYPHGIVIASDGLPLDTLKVLESRPSYNEGGGFDELTRTYLIRSHTILTEEDAAALMPRGRKLGALDMWVVKTGARCLARGVFQIEITARGRFGAIRYYRQTDAVVQQRSQGNTVVTPGVGYPVIYPAFGVQVTTNEGAPTVKTTYVTTAAPDLTQVSETAVMLPAGYPALPAAPVNKWSGIIEPTWVYPALWVLESRPSQALLDETGAQVCWAVEDTHVYYHPVIPGGG